MRVLVTGANGFLGRQVVTALLSLKEDDVVVRCLVREGSSLNGLDAEDVEIVRGSLDDDSVYETLLDGVDILVHLAASMSGSPMGMYSETVVSTERLVRHANASNLARFLFCSSFSVYGASLLESEDVLDEECPLEPQPARRDTYAWCKFYQERWVRENFNRGELTIVRPGVIFGRGKGLLSTRLGLSLPGTPFFLRIGGNARLPLTYVDNCADLIARAALMPAAAGQIINAVDDECPTQKEYLRAYQEEYGRIPKQIWLPYIVFVMFSGLYDWMHRLSAGNLPAIFSAYKAKSMYRRLNYSNERAKSLLDWSPKTGFRDGLARSPK